eukprot:10565598-Alexandrium_andersonii.AAC.1
MNRAWQPIYDGNVEPGAGAAEFLEAYGRHVVAGSPAETGPIKPRELRRAFWVASPTAGGMGGWTPRELRAVPMAACRRLAALLNWIEREGRWPTDLQVAKAANISKNDEPSYNALDY